MFKSNRSDEIDASKMQELFSSELTLLFPTITGKSPSPVDKPLERTLAVIRPSALKLYKGQAMNHSLRQIVEDHCLDVIIKRIEESGFEITRTNEVHLTEDQVEDFYAAKKDKPYFADLMKEMTRCVFLSCLFMDSFSTFFVFSVDPV